MNQKMDNVAHRADRVWVDEGDVPEKSITPVLAWLTAMLTGLLVGTELLTRMLGFEPWRPIPRAVKVDPPGAFFRPHDELGYAGKPGTYRVTLMPSTPSSMTYEVTHDAEGYRISEPPNPASERRPEVWIFGGSFTHGYGVDDHETYPWLFQTRFKSYRVKNYGMDAYGTYHAFKQLRALLSEGKRAAFIILTYASFHDARNVRSRYWTKTLASQPITKGITYPYVRLDDGMLTEHNQAIDYREWPGMRSSAAIHLLEMNYNAFEDRNLRSFEVTTMLIEKMVELARERDIPFLLGGIYPDEATKLTLYALAHRIPTLDLSLSFDDPSLRIMPKDSHPSPKGHQVIARRLINLLEPYLPEPDRRPESKENRHD